MANTAKSKLAELDEHLFAQLDRLDNESLTAEQIAAEVSRSEAIVEIADRLTATYGIRLKAAQLYAEHGDKILPHLPMIGRTNGHGEG